MYLIYIFSLLKEGIYLLRTVGIFKLLCHNNRISLSIMISEGQPLSF